MASTNLNKSSKALFDALLQATGEKPDRVEPGFLTAEQWGEKIGRSKDRARVILNKGVKAGGITVKRFRIETGRGLYPVPHYSINS